MQNPSPLESIQKLRAILLYVKGTYDEKKQTYGITVEKYAFLKQLLR